MIADWGKALGVDGGEGAVGGDGQDRGLEWGGGRVGNVHFLEGFFGGGLWGFGQSVGRGSKRAAGSDFRAVLGQKKGILGSDPKGYGAEWGGAVSPLWLPVVLG